MKTAASFASVAEFLAHALAVEREATTRYEEFADQMEVHHSNEVAALFRRMAGYEREHAQEIERRIGALQLPSLAPWDYRWVDSESPEAAPFDAAHYLMTARHALEIALANERRAQAFFELAAQAATDPEIKRLASEFAEEEREHVRYVEEALASTPGPAPGWDEDLDPASAPD
jgi:rubrerythrin